MLLVKYISHTATMYQLMKKTSMPVALGLIKADIMPIYTGCNRRNGPDFGRVFRMLNYTDITQNTYIQS